MIGLTGIVSSESYLAQNRREGAIKKIVCCETDPEYDLRIKIVVCVGLRLKKEPA